MSKKGRIQLPPDQSLYGKRKRRETRVGSPPRKSEGKLLDTDKVGEILECCVSPMFHLRTTYSPDIIRKLFMNKTLTYLVSLCQAEEFLRSPHNSSFRQKTVWSCVPVPWTKEDDTLSVETDISTDTENGTLVGRLYERSLGYPCRNQHYYRRKRPGGTQKGDGGGLVSF